MVARELLARLENTERENESLREQIRKQPQPRCAEEGIAENIEELRRKNEELTAEKIRTLEERNDHQKELIELKREI